MVVETTPAATPAPAGYGDLLREGRLPLTLAVILLLLVATLDQLIVATALPTIIAQLGGLALYSWAFAAYTLASLHPRALALTSGVWGISSLSGPLVGALLLELWGWPAIFWVNLPLAGLVLLLAWGSLHDAPAGNRNVAPVNLGSPLLLTLATGLLLAAPTVSPRYTWLLATAGLAAAAGFVIAERESRARIVPADAWAARGPLGAALAVIALATVAFFVAQTFLPLLLQNGRGYGAVAVGVLISVGAVAWTVGAMWAGGRRRGPPVRSP